MLEPARDQALKRGDHREFLPLLDPADAPAAELAYPSLPVTSIPPNALRNSA
jgi:hypothetical protein